MGSCCTTDLNDSSKRGLDSRNVLIQVCQYAYSGLENKWFRVSIMLFAVWVMAALVSAQNPDGRVAGDVFHAACCDLTMSRGLNANMNST